MEHSEFVRKFNDNAIKVYVNRETSGYLYQIPSFIPAKLRKRQVLIRATLYIGIAISIPSFFFIKWYLALLLLFGSLSMVKVAQKDAAKGVLKTALEDPYVYEIAIKKNILIIKEDK